MTKILKITFYLINFDSVIKINTFDDKFWFDLCNCWIAKIFNKLTDLLNWQFEMSLKEKHIFSLISNCFLIFFFYLRIWSKVVKLLTEHVLMHEIFKFLHCVNNWFDRFKLIASFILEFIRLCNWPKYYSCKHRIISCLMINFILLVFWKSIIKFEFNVFSFINFSVDNFDELFNCCFVKKRILLCDDFSIIGIWEFRLPCLFEYIPSLR